MLSPKMRRLIAVALSGCLLCAAHAVAYMGQRPTAPIQASVAPSDDKVTTSQDEGVLNLSGLWDLMWKGCDQRVVRVVMNIQQSDATLKVSFESGESIRFDRHRWMSGTVDAKHVTFTVQPRHAKPMTFTGHFENGILCGTTDTGFQWMAMRHFD